MDTLTRAEAHTPGPWHVEDCTVVMAGSQFVADTHHPRSAVGTAEEYANARLIALAPELRDALAAMHCRAAAALEFALADVPEGGCIPAVLTELEHQMRFARALLARCQQ